MSENNYIIVLMTAKDEAEAKGIVQALLAKKLIACGNVINGVDSMFWWEGNIDQAREAMVFMKTKQDLFTQIHSEVQTLHSYDVPELLALPIIGGSAKYIEWLDSSLC